MGKLNSERNYFPYLRTNDGEEWTSNESWPLDIAYEEAFRMKKERDAEEAGVKVYTPGCFSIISWEKGKYWRGRQHYLYKIVV